MADSAPEHQRNGPGMADGGESAQARRVVILAALSLLLALAAWHSLSRWFLIDHAFSACRYARNLVEGHGLAFNPGERVEGYTNFLWTLLCAAAMGAGLSPETAAPAMGMVASLVLLVVLHAWSRDFGLTAGW